ncbi:hypothetical protein, partial [Gilliamella sp. B3780]|uniref:hypothetical protein n=1 Tax=Gilliamella sp. B3780 TaxID=2818024 RepID=UPI00226ACC46
RHKTQDTRHWQPYVKNLYQHTLADLLHLKLNLKLSLVFDLVSRFLLKLKCDYVSNLRQRLLSGLVSHVRQPSSQHHCRRQLSLVNCSPYIVFNIKRYLALIPLLLLPYATTTQALSATTAQVIHGSEPYLTFDNGKTKITTTEGLLGITLSDGTRITPQNNTSTLDNPIVLPKENQSFIDIAMLVPPAADAIALNTLIGEPYNYWGDDDGDTDVIATGSLSLSIVDKRGQWVSRSTVPEICKAPYKVTLSSTNGTLTTRYGVPNSSNFNASSVTYFVNPKATPEVCFSRPDLTYASDRFAGPASMLDPTNGFLSQSTDPSRYGQNFPTTGSNGLYFDLLITGSKQLLSWSPVSQGGITATMSNSTATSVRVTLTGPFATESQQNSDNPGLISKPTLPQTFELVGRDSRGNAVVKYGFTLKQWFVNRSKDYSHSKTLSWCNSIGYRLPKVKDLTNASCTSDFPLTFCDGLVGASPSSPGDYYMRYIGAGFFAEWGAMAYYPAIGLKGQWYWTSEPSNADGDLAIVNVDIGTARFVNNFNTHNALCAYP